MKNVKSYVFLGALSVLLFLGYFVYPNTRNIIKHWVSNYTIFALFNTGESIECKASETIKVALLLDTSNSMDGLIEQTKSQLWKILNELSNVNKDGVVPKLEIALYEYGNDNLSILKGYIRQVSPFTTDMDLISEKLFSLTTNGGSEYCGKAIYTSLNDLKWKANSNDLQLIYIAGNEPFTQGNLSYEKACQLANEKGVIINTIFCGSQMQGINSSWKAGAMMTGGEYMNIDQDDKTVYIETPYDEEISQLNDELNDTYLVFGEQGHSLSSNQRQQDANAAFYSLSNKADRAVFKSSKNYKNEKWDLVDAYEKDKSILKKAKVLPKNLENKTKAEIKQEIEKQAKKRVSIQSKIKTLNDKRRVYQAAQMKKNKSKSDLQNSILQSVKKQAEKKGYKISS